MKMYIAFILTEMKMQKWTQEMNTIQNRVHKQKIKH